MKMMKRWVLMGCILLCGIAGRPQSAEIEQLLLNWEKLLQFKKILQNMYDGYKVLDEGYRAIKDVSEGNFSLHKTFLDGLLEVSPSVKQYKRVADIIDYQIRIVKTYRSAFNQFREGESFTAAEITHIEDVYKRLFDRSVKSIEELLLVLTSGSLRMSDEERLAAIDRIYAAVVDQYSFVKSFTGSTAVLALQRSAEVRETNVAKRLHGIK